MATSRSSAGADRPREDLAILNAIAEGLNSAVDAVQALERTLALVTELLGLRTGWVWLLDPETDQFYSAAARNLPPDLREPVRMAGSWCECIEVFREGELRPKNVDAPRVAPALDDRLPGRRRGRWLRSCGRWRAPSPPRRACRCACARPRWRWRGGSLTETCDAEGPSLITDVETTPGSTSDQTVVGSIHARLAARDLLPAEHLLDAGYVDAGGIVDSRTQHRVELVGPVPADHSWQAQQDRGFDVACFALDWQRGHAICPGGQRSTKWSATHDERGNEIINIRFAQADCLACPLRAHCTRSATAPRNITVRPRDQHEILQAHRRDQATADVRARYGRRAGVEGAISQGVRVADLRRARYFGLAKTRLQHVLTAVGLNIRRLGAWWDEVPPAQTRPAPFLALMPAA